MRSTRCAKRFPTEKCFAPRAVLCRRGDWKFPHFWAIAWLNREDYARAGFRMLPFPDAEGKETGLCAVQYSLPLIPLTLAFGLRAAHPLIYSLGAILLTGWLVSAAIRFWRQPTDVAARKLLKTTVMYLPLLLLLMILAF